MTSALVEGAALLLVLAVNGLLAAAEIAVVSSGEGRLMRSADEGKRGATAALRLLRSPNRFLATVQVGITAVGVAGGVVGGARIAATLAGGLEALGVAAETAGSVALGLVFVGITGLILVLGELVPKRIALLYPETVASRLAPPMERLAALASPLVRLLSRSTELVVRALPLPEPQGGDDVEQEIRGLVARAARVGVLERTEEEIVDQLFALSDQTVGRIMTPRSRIVWLDVDEGPDAWMRRMGPILHTRYLVCEGDLDRLVGHVKVHDLFRRCAAGEDLALRPILRTPHRVHAEVPAFRLLELFQWSGDHLAVVVDDADRIVGLATFHDVLEGIVGEIPEAHEVRPPRLVRRADGSILADGLLPFRRVLAAFGLAPLPGGAHTGDDAPARADAPASGPSHAGSAPGPGATVHGVLAEVLGPEAAPGAVVHLHGLRVEIVDMDGRRIDQVLVSR